MSNNFVFRIQVSFEGTRPSFSMTLTAGNEDEAIKKAKRTVRGETYRVMEVTEKILYGKKEKS